MMPEELMGRAVRLSRKKMRENAGGPFGAVIARRGEIIAEGWNEVTSANDPTAHAEICAIRRACQVTGTFSLAGCEIYTSCEPCPMCLAAIYWARLDRIYYANTRADAARTGFDDSLIYTEMSLEPDQRRLPMVRLESKAAGEVFREWQEKADRINY